MNKQGSDFGHILYAKEHCGCSGGLRWQKNLTKTECWLILQFDSPNPKHKHTLKEEVKCIVKKAHLIV